MSDFKTVQDVIDATLAKFVPEENPDNYKVNVVFTGDGGGEWTLSVEDGTLSFSDGLSEDVQMSFTMAAADFIKHQNGKANTMVLYMRGKIKFKGDFKIGMKLQKVWPRG